MSKNVFDGPEIDLIQMLDAREKRVSIQHQLLKEHPNATLLSASMNIPGPIKTSNALRLVFDDMIQLIHSHLSDTQVIKQMKTIEITGFTYYLLVKLPYLDLKKRMVNIEEKTTLGRLFDLDVLWIENGQIQSVSRVDIGMGRRQCYVCQEDAKECGRSRQHSIEEMQEKIIEMIKERSRDQ